MKSSETYINRQAPPKVAFVPNWRDLSLGCQFMLHMTHVPKAPPLPHMVPKTGTRKQTVPPQGGLLTLSQAISSRVTWRARHQHYCDEPVTPWGLTENRANPATEKVLNGTARHTVTLLTLRGRQVNCSLSWWAKLTGKINPPLLFHFLSPELKWKTHLIVC